MFSIFIRKIGPALRQFCIDPTLGLEISIKASRTNSELIQFLQNPRVSPYHYAVSLRTIGQNIIKSSVEYDFVVSSDFSLIKEQIESYYMDFSLQEIAHIVFFMRVLTNSQRPRAFNKNIEKKILSRANTEIEYADNKTLAIDLYLNLALVQATSGKADAKILSYLRDPDEYFTVIQFMYLLSAGYHSKRNSSKLILLEAIRKIENLDISLLKNEELTDFLQIVCKIDDRFSIGSKFLKNLIDFLLERVQYFEYTDCEKVLGFYNLSDDYDRSLLYQTLNTLDNLLKNGKNPEKFWMLSIIHNLALFKKKNLFITLSPELLEKINSYIESASKTEKIGHIEMGKLLIDLSYIHANLPEKIESAVSSYLKRGRSGMWEILFIRGLSKYRNVDPESILKDYKDMHKNFLTASNPLKLDSMVHILNTKDYSNKKYLPEFLDVCISQILKKSSNWSDFKFFMTSWSDRSRELCVYPEFKPVILKALSVIDQNWDQNEKWFLSKYLFHLYSNDHEIFEKWTSLVEKHQKTLNKKAIRDSVIDIFDKELVEPILQFLIRMYDLETDSSAHVLSFIIKEPSEAILKLAAELIKKTGGDLVSNFNFSVSKWTLFSHVFEKGYWKSLGQFIENAHRVMIFDEKHANTNINVCRIFAVNGVLKPNTASKIFEYLKYSDSEKYLSSYTALVTQIPEKSSELKSLLQKLFELKNDYSLNLIHEKINTYLLVPFVDSRENEFLAKIEMRLALIEPTEIRKLLNLVENLKSHSEVHQDFLKSIISMAAEVLNNKKDLLFFNLAARALIVFAKQGFSDESFYSEIEEKIFNEDFTLDTYVQIVKSYSRISRMSRFYQKACKKLRKNAKFCQPYSDDIIEIVNSEKSSNEDLQNLSIYLKELKALNK